MDSSVDRLDPVQIEIFKKMSPWQKLELSARLYFEARHLKAIGLRMQHPDWSEEQIEHKVTEIFMNART
jgi:hypothetical protein